ncbi:probable chitinase 10 isoform X3 [Mercenaria mercenaria]|uniref:probable chitinase 10 isoform X3 n=1 Tax=Mercenaria mercenaria TaxID=6596 RepID=UPI00234F83F7|nr:probable chitinase 10 isoform X3 [Mercenaria mercenaria]
MNIVKHNFLLLVLVTATLISVSQMLRKPETTTVQTTTLRPDPCKQSTAGFTYGMKEYGCRAYWKCIDGFSVGHCCPNGSAYVDGIGCLENEECNEECAHSKEIAASLLRKPETTTVQTTTPSPGLCDRNLTDKGVGFNPYPGDCTKFVQCWKQGETIMSLVQSCPPGLFWDSELITCRSSFLVQCTAVLKKSGTTTMQTATPSPAIDTSAEST